jgi:hypothetical protein
LISRFLRIDHDQLLDRLRRKDHSYARRQATFRRCARPFCPETCMHQQSSVRHGILLKSSGFDRSRRALVTEVGLAVYMEYQQRT